MIGNQSSHFSYQIRYSVLFPNANLGMLGWIEKEPSRLISFIAIHISLSHFLHCMYQSKYLCRLGGSIDEKHRRGGILCETKDPFSAAKTDETNFLLVKNQSFCRVSHKNLKENIFELITLFCRITHLQFRLPEYHSLNKIFLGRTQI